MILSYVIFTLPFIMRVLTSFFNDLPVEIMRSAAVDGATTFQTFYIEYDSQDHIYDKERPEVHDIIRMIRQLLDRYGE